MRILGFDIETIPQNENNLTRAQQDWIDSKMVYALAKAAPGEDPLEIKRKLMATNPYLGEIVCISLGEIVYSTVSTESIIGTEEEILKRFWEILGSIGPTTFVSFNGLKFDVNFITMRSLHHKILPTNKAFLNTSKFRKFPHFDVMAWMADWGYPAPRLDIACDLAGVKSSKEGDIKAKDVAQAFLDGRITEIAEYCEEDVRATLEVYLQLKSYIRD